MISFFAYVVITTLIRLKFLINTTQNVLTSLFLWYHRFSHREYLLDNLGVSTGTIVVRLFENDYYVSNIYNFFVTILIPMFWFKVRECFTIFKFIKQQKKLWYPNPRSLLQYKSSISHHGGQLIATFYLLCYYHFLILFFDHKYDDFDCFLRRDRRIWRSQLMQWWGWGHDCHHTKILRVPSIAITTKTTVYGGGGWLWGLRRLGLQWGQGTVTTEFTANRGRFVVGGWTWLWIWWVWVRNHCLPKILWAPL